MKSVRFGKCKAINTPTGTNYLGEIIAARPILRKPSARHAHGPKDHESMLEFVRRASFLAPGNVGAHFRAGAARRPIAKKRV